MKKFISILYVFVFFIQNLISINLAWAANNITTDDFTVQVNSGNAVSGTSYTNPGDILSLLVNGTNAGDTIANVNVEYNFSSSQFDYYQPGTVNSYVWWSPVNSNIPTNQFNPPSDNTAPITTSSANGDVMDLYYTKLKIWTGATDYSFVIGARFIGDGYVGNYLNRTIYVNVKPHITDYYFEKSDGSQTTNQVQGSNSESINLVLKVKDYNGCDNVDGGTVTANLSQLGLSSSEPLSYVSCDVDGKTTTFKKIGITTIAAIGTYNFDYNSFSATDENGNINLANDSNTTFDDDDKKSSISLSVIASNTPRLTVITDGDYYIGGPSKPSSTITFSGSQDGELKIAKGSDGTCSGGTTISDWTGSYLSGTTTSKTILATSLTEGANNVYICLKNSSGSVGSITKTITRDTVIPTTTNAIISPGSVTTGNSSITYSCNENGTYQIEKGGSGIPNSGIFIGSGSESANININQNLLNASLSAGNNTIYGFCIDNASNYSSSSGVVVKTAPALSMSGRILSFGDFDNDYDGLDGRDIGVSWDNSGVVGSNFESYRLFLLPSNVTLNTSTHTYVKLIASGSTSSFTGDTSITKDSTNTALVSGASYKVCMAIMGTDGVYGSSGCSSTAILLTDVVQHATITSAKFNSLTNLELTTDATLDTSTGSHSGGLISFKIGSTSYTGTSIASIDGKKINITIPSLPSSSSTGNTLIALTGAIRSSGGGFNNYFSSGSMIITDGIAPIVSNFATGTVSPYGGFYSGTVVFSYSLDETLQMGGNTYIEFNRVGGNSDSTRTYSITDSTKVSTGSHSISVDLAGIGLVSGAYYDVRFVAKDIAGNTSYSSFVSGIKFDNTGPSIPSITQLTSLATLTPTFNWTASTDDNGYGAGLRDYRITIYNPNVCSVGNTYTGNTLIGLTYTLGVALPTNDHDYCWNIYATDNMGNIGGSSTCDSFHVNTLQPVISGQQVKDVTINSTTYAKSGNNIEVTANISSTNSGHIWANLSSITGNAAHNDVNCATPGTASITCSYTAGSVKYSFVGGFSGTVSSGVKQIGIYAQNTTGLNQTSTSIASITFDNTNPSISGNPITQPTTGTVWGGNSQVITWSASAITDNLGIANIKLEYSSGGAWQLIGSKVNDGTYAWDISSLTSGNNNYQTRITAYDAAGNSATATGNTFSVDKIAPTIPGGVITSPSSGGIYGGGKVVSITWNSAGITDSNLNANGIKLEYSLDNGTNWTLIASSQANNGTYSWTTPSSVNVTQAKVRLTSYDTAGNYSSGTSSAFVIDSTLPTINVTFAGNGGSTPQNGSYINNSGIDISGGATDSYLDKIQYTLQNIGDTTYRNTSGSGWLGTQSWNTICQDATSNGTSNNCTTINQTINPTGITNGVTYRLTIKSTDEATNEKTYNAVDYIGDTVAPLVNFTTSSGTYFSGSINISGTGSDSTSGLSSINIEIKKGAQWWDGSTWSGAQVLLLTSTSNNYANWNYNFNAPAGDDDGQVYNVIVTAYDKAFKTNNSTTRNINVILDESGPAIDTTNFWSHPTSGTGEIAKGGSSYIINWGTGNITYSGAGLGTNPIKLEYFNGSSYVTITGSTANNGSYTFTLPSLDVDSSIRLTATDSLGNSNGVISPTFTIDSTPPTIARIETIGDTLGQISGLNVYFSEIIQTAGIDIGDFSVAGSTLSGVYITSLNSGGTGSILKINFNSSTGTTASTPTLVYNGTSIVDRANNNLVNTSQSSVDAAYPVINYATPAEAYDIGNTGKINQIKAYFSENMQTSTDVSAWLIGAPLSVTAVSLTNGNNYALLTISGSTTTSSSGINLQFNPNSNYKDTVGNYSNSVIVTPLTINDVAKPIANSAITSGSNGVDTITVNFSESLSGTLDNSNFSLSGGTLSGNISLDGTRTILSIPIIKLNDTSIKPIVTYSGTAIKDDYNNTVNNFSITPQDGVKPYVLSRETQDVNHNGLIDAVKITFSENLNTSTGGIVATVGGYSVNNYNISSNVLLIGLQELSSFDTSATPSVQITSNGILDLAGNNYNLEGSPTTATDKVGPVISNTRFDGTDKIYVTFSENYSGTLNSSSFILSGATSTINSVTANSNTNTGIINLSGSGITYGTTEISFASGSVGDIYENKQSGTNFLKLTATVVINEVMWSNTGAKASQYIELRNLGTTTIDLTGWKIKNAGADIVLSGNIGANGLYLVTKSATNSSLLTGALTPDLIAGTMDISTGSTLTVEDSTTITFDSAYISGNIGENDILKSMERNTSPGNGTNEANWYTAVFSANFDNNTPKGTPGSANISDNIAPSIDSYSPTNNTLFPTGGNVSIRYNYSDAGGINASSYTFLLEKNNGAGVFSDITNTNLTSSGVSTSSGIFNYSNLSFGQYKATFSIQDITGNNSNQVIIFYVDQVEMTISNATRSIGTLDPNSGSYYTSQSATITVKTVGAGINLVLGGSGSMGAGINTIIPWNGTKGFGFTCSASDYGSCVAGTRPINNTVIDSSSGSLETNGNQKSYTYTVVYGAKIDIINTAGNYDATTKYLVNFDY